MGATDLWGQRVVVEPGFLDQIDIITACSAIAAGAFLKSSVDRLSRESSRARYRGALREWRCQAQLLGFRTLMLDRANLGKTQTLDV